MVENVHAFEKALRENEELRAKLEAELKRIAANKEAETDDEAFAKAAKTLGFDFTAADIAKSTAETQELDPEELAQGAGGEWCALDYGCVVCYAEQKPKEESWCWIALPDKAPK